MFSVSNVAGRELKAAQCNLMAGAVSRFHRHRASCVCHPALQTLKATWTWDISGWGIPVNHRLPCCKDSGHLGDNTKPFFSISFPMQNRCQINSVCLFGEKGNVGMKVFAFNTRTEKLPLLQRTAKSFFCRQKKQEEKVWEWDYWQRNCKRQLWRSCQTKKKDWYYFREVRFDPSHAAVWTNVQRCKLLTYHHAYYLLP